MKVSHLPTYQTLGATGHAPRGAIAVKLPAERVQTALLDVLWSVGRTGVVTPVAVLEPVVLGGVRVARATLHNVDELGRKQLQKGARVEVERAGEVIPRVVRAVSAGHRGYCRAAHLPPNALAPPEPTGGRGGAALHQTPTALRSLLGAFGVFLQQGGPGYPHAGPRATGDVL